MATETKPSAPASHASRVAVHKERVATLVSERDLAVEKANAAAREALTRHAEAHAAQVAATHAAHELAFTSSQRLALDALVPALEAFLEKDDRTTAAHVAAVWRDAEAAALHATGTELSSNTIGHAFATIVVQRDPSMLGKLANPIVWHAIDVGGCTDYCDAAARALRNSAPHAAAQQLAKLLELEAAISKSASNLHPIPEAIAATMFDLVRFGGSKSAVSDAIVALQKPVVNVAKQQRDFEAYRAKHSRGFQILEALGDGLGSLATATANAVIGGR